MDYVDSLLQRNGDFASDSFNPALKMMPSKKALIIGCVDPRVDPAEIFKLEAGEAAVIRNAGGRVNPALVETLGILRVVGKAVTGKTEPELNLIVLHHTDCGIKHCYHHAPELLAQHMGVASAGLDELAVNDPYKSVAVDIEALRANPKISSAFTVSGLVYDVATGKVETVVPSQRLRPEEN
jgi:carbonic anhydrase